MSAEIENAIKVVEHVADKIHCGSSCAWGCEGCIGAQMLRESAEALRQETQDLEAHLAGAHSTANLLRNEASHWTKEAARLEAALTNVVRAWGEMQQVTAKYGFDEMQQAIFAAVPLVEDP